MKDPEEDDKLLYHDTVEAAPIPEPGLDLHRCEACGALLVIDAEAETVLHQGRRCDWFEENYSRHEIEYKRRKSQRRDLLRQPCQ